VRHATPTAMWRARLAATPHRTFLIDAERTWTFADMDLARRRAGGGLAALGVREGTRVLVGMNNRAETLIIHQALAALGAVLVPLLPGLSAAELGFQATHSGAAVLIADDPVAGLLATPVEHRVTGDAIARLLAHDPIDEPDLAGDDTAPFAILYTSGSTGHPKGVVIPRGAFYSTGTGYAERVGLTEADNVLVATPLAHAVGAVTCHAMAIHKGSRMTLLDRFSPSNWWAQVARHQGTAVILFPAQLKLLMLDGMPAPEAPTSLRLVITHMWDETFKARFGVELALCWGMTETGGVGTASEPGYAGEHGEGYVGPPFPGAEVAIGDDGEIRLRHPHVMLEYLNDPEATAGSLTTDGWVRSGDRGELDERGHLRYLGRAKNIIKRAGENVGAEEVEAVLDALEGVAESIVFGVPDPVKTEEILAVVVPRAGVRLAPEAVAAAAAVQLARWKVPRFIVLSADPLPRLGNGKLDRVSAKARTDVAAAWDGDRVRAGQRA
jgi:acyl-CoA synthetase (AMP-forming)/AMP-acid ligase II